MTPGSGTRRWPFVAGASVQGRNHRARGGENQDAFRSATSPDGRTIVIAISDGAGSRTRSALGSALAADIACQVLAYSPPGPDGDVARWQAWLSAAGQAIIAEYRRIAGHLWAVVGQPADRSAGHDLAATLAAAVISPPWTGFLSLGDCFGAVLVRGSPERCFLVLPPDSYSEFTVFLSSPSAPGRMRSFLLWDPDLSGVMLATDGCAALALDHPGLHGLAPEAGPQPAPGFFVGLAAAVRAVGGSAEPIHALLSGEPADRCPDDLTVVCALAGTS
jgi:hypothetical protein